MRAHYYADGAGHNFWRTTNVGSSWLLMETGIYRKAGVKLVGVYICVAGTENKRAPNVEITLSILQGHARK